MHPCDSCDHASRIHQASLVAEFTLRQPVMPLQDTQERQMPQLDIMQSAKRR